jgi:hypothetical protein
VITITILVCIDENWVEFNERTAEQLPEREREIYLNSQKERIKNSCKT